MPCRSLCLAVTCPSPLFPPAVAVVCVAASPLRAARRPAPLAVSAASPAAEPITLQLIDRIISPSSSATMDRYDAVAASASDVARSKSASQQHPNAAPADAHAEHTHTANEGGQLSPVPSVSTRSGSISDTPGSQTSLSSAGSSLSSASSLSAMAGGSTGSTGGASGNSLSPAQTSTGGSSIGVLTPSGTAVSAGSDDGTILFVGDLSRGVVSAATQAAQHAETSKT